MKLHRQPCSSTRQRSGRQCIFAHIRRDDTSVTMRQSNAMEGPDTATTLHAGFREAAHRLNVKQRMREATARKAPRLSGIQMNLLLVASPNVSHMAAHTLTL